jgi:DNA-binding winged helix-turn-helix (wHTH) protein/tetratricopeptide (TPR) repeat protein
MLDRSVEPTTTHAGVPRASVLRFGPYQLDRQTGELSGDGRKLKLQVQPFQVLAALLERPGEVVTREDLRRKLWSGDTFVDFDNSVNIAVRKLRQALHDDANEPRFIETLPKRGYRFIAPVEPSVKDMAAPDAPAVPPAAHSGVQTGVQGWLRRFAARGALAAALLAVAAGAYLLLGRLGSPANAGIRVRPAVAVMGFRNLATKSDRAWVSTALEEMFASELAAAGRLRTVPGENVARASIDLRLPDTGSFSAPTLGRIRNSLRADYVLTGSYFDAGAEGGGRLRLDLRLEDTRDGETLWASTESGSEADLPDMVAHAGLDLRAKLGFAASGQDRAEFQAAAPPTSDASRLYAEGLARLRQFDAKGALELLNRAVATAPEYAPAHAALAAAWSALGYGEMARLEAGRALDLAKGLPREQRLSIEARFDESAGQWDKAAVIYRQLGNLFPDDPDYGLRCAAAQVKAGRGTEALATVETLRAKPAAVRDDAAIDYALSLAANQTGDFRQAQAAAARSAAKAEQRDEWMLVADARLLECRELEALGSAAPAETSCATASRLYARAGDRAGVASATGYQAAALAGAGDHDGAQRMYQTALSIQRDIGNQGGALWDLNGLAGERWAKDDLAGAREKYEEALRTAQQIKSRPDAADARANIGFTWLTEGDLAQARKTYDHALAEFREMSNANGVANALGNLGETLYQQGDLPEAAQRLEEALMVDRRNGNKGETANALAWLGRVRLAAGDADGARARYAESLQAWREMGEFYATPLRVRMAELDLESGQAASAEARIGECLAALHSQKRVGAELTARTLLARALLAQGKREEARREVEQGAPLAAASQSRARRLEFAIAAARVRAASGGLGDSAAAIKALEAVAAEGSRYGFAGLGFEAQLAMGEIELAAGRESAGLGRLRKLEREAQARGFLTIARAARKRV